MQYQVRLFFIVVILPVLVISTAGTTSSSATTSSSTSRSVTLVPKVTTGPPAPTSLHKPENGGSHASVFAIKTIDFSQQKPTTTEAPVNTCFSNDMCSSMPGICNKGTCKTKKCTLDIVCLCQPGITGQFCDKNVSEVNKNGANIVNDKIVSTTPVMTTTTSKGKTHVNGHVDTSLINSLDIKAAFGSNKLEVNAANAEESVTTTAKSTSTQSKNTNVNDGTTTVSASAESLTTNKNAIYTANTKDKPISRSAVNNNVVTTMNPKGMPLQTTTNGTTTTTASREVFPDGSYKKGPEAIVLSDNSPLMVNPSDQEVRTSAPSVIEQKTDVLKISTTTIEQNRVSMIPNGPLSNTRNKNRIKSNTGKKNNGSNKSKGVNGTKDTKPRAISKTTSENVPSNVVGVQQLKDAPSTDSPSAVVNIDIPVPTDSNGNSDSNVSEHNSLKVNPVTDTIEKAKSVLLAQKSGSVDITNDFVTGHALFENKEITIIIEKAKDSAIQTNGRKGMGETLNAKPVSQENGKQSNFKEFNVGPDTVKDMVKNREPSNKANLNNQNTQKANRENDGKPTQTTTKAPNKTGTPSVDTTENSSSSSNAESNSTKTATVDLNPLLQLLNMIGSREFVDHVSAVKIEIITKPNSNTSSSEKPTDVGPIDTVASKIKETNSVDLSKAKQPAPESSAPVP